MNELLWILLLGAGLALWLATRRRSDLARRVCRQVCQQAGVVLLDDSVAFHKRLTHRGRPLRSYDFEWTRDGQQRHAGQVWLDGDRVEYLHFDDGGRATLINAP